MTYKKRKRRVGGGSRETLVGCNRRACLRFIRRQENEPEAGEAPGHTGHNKRHLTVDKDKMSQGTLAQVVFFYLQHGAVAWKAERVNFKAGRQSGRLLFQALRRAAVPAGFAILNS